MELALPVDRIDRIVPRVQDRAEQRKRVDRTPGSKDERDKSRPETPRERKPADEDEDDRTIDILVQSRRIPTGQILPGFGADRLAN